MTIAQFTEDLSSNCGFYTLICLTEEWGCMGCRKQRDVFLSRREQTAAAGLPFRFLIWDTKFLCLVRGQQPSVLPAKLLSGLTPLAVRVKLIPAPAGCLARAYGLWRGACQRKHIFPLRDPGEEGGNVGMPSLLQNLCLYCP